MSMFDILWQSSQAAVGTFMAHAVLYTVFATAAWLIFYRLFRRVLLYRKIARSFPSWKQTQWETYYSLRSTVIFGLVNGLISIPILCGWSQVYWNIEDYGWGWFVGSIVLAIFVHDAYFYWTHRLMHHRRLFRSVHQVHHLSISPTPWATYSFSVSEAFIQAGIAPLLIFSMPLHPLAFALFIFWQISFNVLGHCGFEIFPRWFLRCWLGKFMNSPTHHALHHERFKANYSLYFNIWDRLMGTNHRDYEKRYDEVTADKPVESLTPLASQSHFARMGSLDGGDKNPLADLQHYSR